MPLFLGIGPPKKWLRCSFLVSLRIKQKGNQTKGGQKGTQQFPVVFLVLSSNKGYPHKKPGQVGRGASHFGLLGATTNEEFGDPPKMASVFFCGFPVNQAKGNQAKGSQKGSQLFPLICFFSSKKRYPQKKQPGNGTRVQVGRGCSHFGLFGVKHDRGVSSLGCASLFRSWTLQNGIGVSFWVPCKSSTKETRQRVSKKAWLGRDEGQVAGGWKKSEGIKY